jgi:hypothetical protein
VAGRERVKELESMVDQLRTNFNQERALLVEKVEALAGAAKEGCAESYQKDIFVKYLKEQDQVPV